MKKLFPLLIAFTLLFSFPLPTFAAESNDRQQNTSFEISLEEALALADPSRYHCTKWYYNHSS